MKEYKEQIIEMINSIDDEQALRYLSIIVSDLVKDLNNEK